MSVSADVLAAREQLTRHGWVARNSESFRHLPPPPAALWLGEQVAESAPRSERAGWTLQPTGSTPHTHTTAQWLDAADAAQRQALFEGLPLPGTGDADDAAPFGWAHRALCRQGLRARIDQNTTAPAANAQAAWLTLSHQPRAAVEAPLAVLDIGAGVQAVLLETHERRSHGTAALVQNLQLHLRLGAGASLIHLRVLEPHADDQIAHHVHVRLAGGASYRQALIGEGSRYHLQRLLLELDEESASASAGVVALAAGTALDFQALVRHKAARTRSQVRALALARDAAQVVLNAHTRIAAGCDDADVHQRLAGIPLRGQPKLVLRPHLEILHDQVQATHGATWGALPEDALFYAQQRGIESRVARGLIVQGMANKLLGEALGDEMLADALQAPARLARAVARLLDEDGPCGATTVTPTSPDPEFHHG